MKPISEYGFREIVGKFVVVQIKLDTSNCDSYIGYCYIDIEQGMSIKILGALATEINISDTEVITLRCSKELNVEIYSGEITKDMQELADAIEKTYTPSWIHIARDNKEYDPYRDIIFPDDLLIPVRTKIDGEGYEELIWVRPVRFYNNRLYGITIEDGQWVPRDTVLVILKTEGIPDRDIVGACISCFEGGN